MLRYTPSFDSQNVRVTNLPFSVLFTLLNQWRGARCVFQLSTFNDVQNTAPDNFKIGNNLFQANCFVLETTNLLSPN